MANVVRHFSVLFTLTVELNNVEAEVGLNKLRSDLTRLECHRRRFEGLNHSTEWHVAIESALFYTVVFVTRILAKLVGKFCKILARLRTLEYFLSKSTLWAGRQFWMRGDDSWMADNEGVVKHFHDFVLGVKP